MESKPTDLDVGVASPTPSQEERLLNEPGALPGSSTSSTSTTVNAKQPPATLREIKHTLEKNAKKSSDELTISLHTGAVIITDTHKARHRKFKANSDAAQAGRSSVNPHVRVQSEMNSATNAKRSRVTGDTPPNIAQQAKKFSGNKTDTPTTAAGWQKNGSQKTGDTSSAANSAGQFPSTSRNERRKRAKLLKKQNAANRGTVGDGETEHASGQREPNTSGTTINQQNVQSGTDAHGQTDGIDEPNPASTTYVAAVNSHTMAIIDQHRQGQMQLLTQDRVDKINSLLTDAVISQADSGKEAPVFENARLHSGAMRVVCANNQTRQWLEQNVPALDSNKLWKGAHLVVMEFKDIPKPHKFNVVFRNVNKGPKELFKLLEVQNKGISTKSWTVLSNVKRDNGTTMTIGVGQDSFETLRDRSNTLYCGMGKAFFTVVKSCKENQAIPQSGATKTSTNAAADPPSGEPQNQSDPGKTDTEEMEVAMEGDAASRVDGQTT